MPSNYQFVRDDSGGRKISTILHDSDQHMVCNAIAYYDNYTNGFQTVGNVNGLPVALPMAASGAFGRQRTSEPFTVFDSKLIADNQPFFWDEETTGTGSATYTQAAARVRLATAADGDAVARQTFRRFNYQPGKSQEIMMTFLAPQESNVTKRLGYLEINNDATYSPQEGVCLEVIGDDVKFVIYKAGVVTESVSQIDWNVDKMDGTGASGITLDLNACQILFIDFEWLGVGSLRIGFVINGVIRYCHVFNHANDPTFTSVYMTRPNMPLSYTISQSGDGSGYLDQICSTVISEGGTQARGINRASGNGTAAVTFNGGTGVRQAMLGIRLKSTNVFETLLLSQVSAAIATNDRVFIEVILNPAVAGTFTFNGATNSCAEIAVGGPANLVTGGAVIVGNMVSNQTREINITGNLQPVLGAAIDGTRDIFVVSVMPLSANPQISSALSWFEQD